MNIYRCIVFFQIIYIYIYNIYIYIFNSWNIDCDLGFHGVFCKTTIIRQLRKWNKSKIEKIRKSKHKKPLGFRMKVLRVVTSM